MRQMHLTFDHQIQHVTDCCYLHGEMPAEFIPPKYVKQCSESLAPGCF